MEQDGIICAPAILSSSCHSAFMVESLLPDDSAAGLMVIPSLAPSPFAVAEYIYLAANSARCSDVRSSAMPDRVLSTERVCEESLHAASAEAGCICKRNDKSDDSDLLYPVQDRMRCCCAMRSRLERRSEDDEGGWRFDDGDSFWIFTWACDVRMDRIG